ncbi:MAG TPA: hypothetical protein VGB36_00325 [Gammaproteobacteria bacterium]
MLPRFIGSPSDDLGQVLGFPGYGVYPFDMNVELTRDQRAFVQRAIESGRFTREEEAVQEALALWEERERRRLEILAAVDEAEASLARGEGREVTEDSMKELAEEIKERGRRRLAAERTQSY